MASASALLSPYHSVGAMGSLSTRGVSFEEGPEAASDPHNTSRFAPAASIASHTARVPSAFTFMNSSRVGARRMPAR